MNKSFASGLCLTLSLLGAAVAQAEDIRIPVGQQGDLQLSLPAKGLSMNQVSAQFGEPQKVLPARGEPPITRWQYENFMVYFEGNYVIHSVQRFKPKAEHQTPSSTQSDDH